MAGNAALEGMSEEHRAALSPLAKRYRHGENPLNHLADLMEMLPALDDALFLVGAKLAFATLLDQRREVFPEIRMKHVPVVARESWLAVCAVFDRAGSQDFFAENSRVRAEVESVLTAIAAIRAPSTSVAVSQESAHPFNDQMLARAGQRLAAAADMFHVPQAVSSPSSVSGVPIAAPGIAGDGLDRAIGRILDKAHVG